MKQILIDFAPSPYVGLIIETDGDETEFLNALINAIIDESTYSIDEEALEEEAVRAEGQLRDKLKEDGKSIGAFCYISGITEDQLHEFCKANLVRTAVENAAILSIADAEGIRVTDDDLASYKRSYRDQYARVLLTEPDLGDDELREAILTRKVLNFLKNNNTSKQKGGS